MLGEFLAFTRKDPTRFQNLVILPDIASDEKLEELLTLQHKISPSERVSSIFMDCANDVLVRRYSETRRPHPEFDPENDKTIIDAVERERTRLNAFREQSNLFLDTSSWSVHDLRRALSEFVDSLSVITSYSIRINFLSFGFKHGIPADCDLVIDARFLPNPFFVAELKEHDGLDPKVSEYVLKNPLCEEFLARYTELLQFLIPTYIDGGKAYLNIGIGCTGGKHRSVAIAEELGKRFSNPRYFISAKHRDRTKLPI